MSRQARYLYEFGPFRLEETERRLLREGRPVPLPPKIFETLLLLVQRSGHVVEKDEIMKAIWPDSFVEEANLTQYVFALRRALGEDESGDPYIETVPKHGYRFAAAVNESEEEPAGLVLEKHTSLHIFAEEVQTSGIRAAGQVLKSLPSTIRQTGWRPSRTVLAVTTLTVLAGLGVALYSFWVSNQSNAAKARTAPKSIAVLPFKSLGAETDDKYLCRGMADALIGRLTSLKQITVLPTSAVRVYADQEYDAATVGQKLGVESVLEGSIQRSGDRIRVSVQLVSARDGASIWAENFDGPFTEFFAVQDAISSKVVNALALELTSEQTNLLSKRYSENAEAYQAYLKGRYLLDRRGNSDLGPKALEYYEQAIRLDPNFALAFAGLAEYHIYASEYALAKTAASKALEIDDGLAEAHAALGLIKQYDWDWPGAEKEFRRALELDPNYAMAHLWYGGCIGLMGRDDEVDAEYQRALDLDPLSLVINTTVGGRFYVTRQYDKAIEQYRRTLELDPNDVWPRLRLAQALGTNGQHAEALVEYQTAVESFRDQGGVNAGEVRLGQFYAFSGQRAKAMRILNKWKRVLAPNYDVALIYVGLGENDRAFALLEKVYEKRDPHLLGLRNDPRLDAFRTDPRYAELIRRMGLQP